MNDADEDIYVQLEAAAALAAYDDPNAWEFIESKLHSTVMTVPLETQLETVIVASEIPKERSESILIGVLQDSNRNDELRAGAAWALGQFASATSVTALVNTFNSSSLEIKIEAARALLRIAEPQVPHLVDLLMNCESPRRDGISWALARTGNFNPAEIVADADDNLRRWISYMVGYGKENFAQADVEAICNADPEVYFAASVLWQIVTSWVHDLKEY
jgi:HEAT repeat protein